MKAILISIKPKWCAKIMNGEKTIEIRKTMPKCDLPIDVYIYCTKEEYLTCDLYTGKARYHNIPKGNNGFTLSGKVVAKFTLNKVERIMFMNGVFIDETKLLKQSCLNEDELFWYLAPQDTIVKECGYAWHIDNLEIFDKPKELSEFNKYGCKQYDNDVCETYGKRGHLYTNCFFHLTKAPQSFCFIEVK